MKRSSFIKNSMSLALALKLNPLLAQKSTELWGHSTLVKANEEEVAKIILTHKNGINVLKRILGFDLANLSAAFVEKTSIYFEKDELRRCMMDILSFIKSQQKLDGTLDLGNLASPPDTAFIIEPICAAGNILKNISQCEDINKLIKEVIEKAGVGLCLGGVHTPNHRWVVSAALAKINHLYPHQKYTKRIDEWLSEGVYCDEDGVYLERSIIYAEVINRSLISIAQYANKPQLLNLVNKNLKWVFECMEANGDLVTFASRRQDAFMKKDILLFYPQFRFMANQLKDTFMGGVASFIETLPDFKTKMAKDLLYLFTEDKILAKAYPKENIKTDFHRFFEGINMVRSRRDNITYTLFGGADWPIVIASGRSTNPSFFGYKKRQASLKHIRMSSSFFNTGFFRSDGLKKLENKYILTQKIEVPYYQPLPEAFKKGNGDYELRQSVDGRFWNKMDFENRQISNLSTLTYRVSFEEHNEHNELIFDVKGPEGVPVIIEMCFEKGGKLNGCSPILGRSESLYINAEMAEYKNGGDSIMFGPGKFIHNNIENLEGEMYTTHFGSLKGDGLNVYITGKTPFNHVLKIR
jgi:hypothetical protein